MIDYDKLEKAAFANMDTEVLDLFDAGATDAQIMKYIKDAGLPISYDEIKKEKSIPEGFNEKQARAFQQQNEDVITEKQLNDYIVASKNKQTVERAKQNEAGTETRRKELASAQSLTDAWNNEGIYDSPYFKDMNKAGRLLTALGFKVLSPKMADDYYIKTGNVDGELAARAGLGAALNTAEWAPQVRAAKAAKAAENVANAARLAANPAARSVQENIVDSDEAHVGDALKDAVLNTGLNAVIDKPKETLGFVKSISGGIMPKALETTLKGTEEIIGAEAHEAARQKWLKELRLNNDYVGYAPQLEHYVDTHTPEEIYKTAKQLSEDGFNKTAEDMWALMSKQYALPFTGFSADALPFRHNHTAKILETADGSLISPTKDEAKAAAEWYSQKIKDYPKKTEEWYAEAEKAELVDAYRRAKSVDDLNNKTMTQRVLAGLIDSKKRTSIPARAGVREFVRPEKNIDFTVAGYLNDKDLVRMWEEGFVPPAEDAEMRKAYDIWRKH